MKIDDALIKQWEPKITRMISTYKINGLHRDDLAQELRMCILKAAKRYDPERQVTFHTYLHTTMVNTLRTLIVKAQRKHIDVQSIDALLYSETGEVSNKIQQALGVSEDSFENLEILELLRNRK